MAAVSVSHRSTSSSNSTRFPHLSSSIHRCITAFPASQAALPAGKWLVSQGGELEWSSGDKWNVILEIPAGAIVEYKYVLLEGDGVTAVAWQQGNNNVLAVGHADDNVEAWV